MSWRQRLASKESSMSFCMREIGGRLYLFTREDRSNQACIIDSHGGQLFMGNTRRVRFRVPDGVSVHFYSEHNQTLTSRDVKQDGYWATDLLRAVMGGDRDPVETVEGGQLCPDYNLQKFLRAHKPAKGDTKRRSRMDYKGAIGFMNVAKADKDLVTIRNRQSRWGSITLSQTIALLLEDGNRYTDIHCTFCRSAMFSGKSNPVQAMNEDSGDA
jgi:hypothetical protein